MYKKIGSIVLFQLLLTGQLWADDAAILAEIRALRHDVQQLSTVLRGMRASNQDGTSVHGVEWSADAIASDAGNPKIRIDTVSSAGAPEHWAKPELYRLEPPDEVWIEIPHVVPNDSYRIQPGDELKLTIRRDHSDSRQSSAKSAPVSRFVQVSLEGTVSLEYNGEPVMVDGMTAKEAGREVKRVLTSKSESVDVSVEVSQASGKARFSGKFAIRPDGCVYLGQFGSVYVSGMTIAGAQDVIARLFETYLIEPKVVVQLFALNSKVCYVVIEDAAKGSEVHSMELRGNETVLDGLASLGGISVSDKQFRLLRSTGPHNTFQELSIDIDAITKDGATDTNYQLLPGDRLLIGKKR